MDAPEAWTPAERAFMEAAVEEVRHRPPRSAAAPAAPGERLERLSKIAR